MGSDAAAAPSGGEAQQDTGQDQGQGFDPSQVTQQLETFGQGQEELRQLVQQLGQQLTPAEQEEQQSEQEIDLSQFWQDPGLESDPEAQAQHQQALQEAINQMVEQRVQQAITPLQQNLQEFRDEQAMTDLAQEFPILGEQPEVADHLVKAAHTLAAEQGWAPEVANSPAMLRTVFLASVGARALNDESQGSEAGADAGAHIEGAGGAGPAPSMTDLAQQIVTANGRKGAGALPL